MNVLRHSPPTEAFYHWREEGEVLKGMLIVFCWFQFEYMAQHLVFANCIPLILKFFNQNIMSYITAKNR